MICSIRRLAVRHWSLTVGLVLTQWGGQSRLPLGCHWPQMEQSRILRICSEGFCRHFFRKSGLIRILLCLLIMMICSQNNCKRRNRLSMTVCPLNNLRTVVKKSSSRGDSHSSINATFLEIWSGWQEKYITHHHHRSELLTSCFDFLHDGIERTRLPTCVLDISRPPIFAAAIGGLAMA